MLISYGTPCACFHVNFCTRPYPQYTSHAMPVSFFLLRAPLSYEHSVPWQALPNGNMMLPELTHLLDSIDIQVMLNGW
jgi:hypothetical protein